jgi:hypothetical protein
VIFPDLALQAGGQRGLVDPRTGQRSERYCDHSKWLADNLLTASVTRRVRGTVCAGGRDRDRTCDFCRVKGARPQRAPSSASALHHSVAPHRLWRIQATLWCTWHRRASFLANFWQLPINWTPSVLVAISDLARPDRHDVTAPAAVQPSAGSRHDRRRVARRCLRQDPPGRPPGRRRPDARAVSLPRGVTGVG